MMNLVCVIWKGACPYSAGLVVARSVWQDERGAAQGSAAGVRGLREVQAAGQHREVVGGHGDRSTDVPAMTVHQDQEEEIHVF